MTCFGLILLHLQWMNKSVEKNGNGLISIQGIYIQVSVTPVLVSPGQSLALQAPTGPGGPSVCCLSLTFTLRHEAAALPTKIWWLRSWWFPLVTWAAVGCRYLQGHRRTWWGWSLLSQWVEPEEHYQDQMSTSSQSQQPGVVLQLELQSPSAAEVGSGSRALCGTWVHLYSEDTFQMERWTDLNMPGWIKVPGYKHT